MTVGNTHFKKRTNHLVTYEFGPSETHAGSCLARRNQRTFLKDIKALPSEEYNTQHKSLVCDFIIGEVKDTRTKFVPKSKIQKLHKTLSRLILARMSTYEESS